MEQKQARKISLCSSPYEFIIDVYISLFMIIFPLIFHDSYYDILQVKYLFYCTITSLLILSVLITFLCLHIKTKNKWRFKNFFFSLPFCEKMLILFWIGCLISTMQSDYFYESFWGNEGRYNGLFLMTLYLIMYFLISRLGKLKQWHIHLFMISGFFVCILGITDYFQMDLLNFRRTANEIQQGKIFASTIGNFNTYTAYVALISSISAILFFYTEKKQNAIWYYFNFIISTAALIMGVSDNSFLSMGTLFVVLPFLNQKSNSKASRLWILLASYCSIILLVSQIDLFYKNVVIGQSGIYRFIGKTAFLPIITITLWMIALLLMFKKIPLIFKNQQPIPYLKIWKILLISAFAIILFFLLDVNVLGNQKRYGSWTQYLLFSDSWGSNRGFIWKKALELYCNFSSIHKIFGYGPDTFAILSTQTIQEEMYKISGTYFDSVHNEYLHYLLTIGPAATIAYIFFIAGVLKNMFQLKDNYKWLTAMAMAVLCYMTQAIININVPLVAPMVWLFLSLGMSVFHKNPNE